MWSVTQQLKRAISFWAIPRVLKGITILCIHYAILQHFSYLLSKIFNSTYILNKPIEPVVVPSCARVCFKGWRCFSHTFTTPTLHRHDILYPQTENEASRRFWTTSPIMPRSKVHVSSQPAKPTVRHIPAFPLSPVWDRGVRAQTLILIPTPVWKNTHAWHGGFDWRRWSRVHQESKTLVG